MIERAASSGKYRVIGVDTFDGTAWIEREYDTYSEAISHARARVQGKQMLKMHVYNDAGTHLGEAGVF